MKKVKMRVIEQAEPADIKPGSRYCDEHPDDPRCKAHKKAIHGEQATDAPADCGEGKIWDAKQGKCVPTGETGQNEQVVTTDITKPLSTGQRDLGIGAVEPDEHGQCPDGYTLNDTMGKCVRDETCPEGKHFDQKSQQCVSDQPPKVETPETAVGVSPAPAETLITVDTTPGEAPYDRPMPVPEPTPPSPSSTKPSQMPPEAEPAPEAQPLEPLTPTKTPPLQPPEPNIVKPKEPHVCPAGQIYDYGVNQCVPTEPLTKQEMLRITRTAEYLTLQAYRAYHNLVEEYNVLNKDLAKRNAECSNLEGRLEEQKKQINKFDQENKNYRMEHINDETKLRDKNRRIEDLTIQRDDYIQQRDKLSKLYEDTLKDKDKWLRTATALNEKITKATEEAMLAETKVERLEHALKKKDIQMKKGLKVRVKV